MAARIKTRDLVTDWRRGDGAKLARFMNESGRGWPGGGWDPQTPEEAQAYFREQRRLGAFVAEVGDRIVAFCDVSAKPGERNRAYVPFLNGHPDYQGQGFGKAVLLRAVERVYELGIARVDLHTWPGNLKAVPLYKKSGFMWSPDHAWGVLMQNFTPGARRHPVAQEFFRKHDWYGTMKRDLSLTADDHKRGKVKVYRYEWEEAGDRLRMVYDRQSWGLLEIETSQFLVGCSLEDEKLVAGLPQRIRWRIVNHGSRPVEIALVASADEGIKLDHKQILTVQDHAELSAQFEVDPEIREKEREPRAPIVRTDIILDGTPIRLEAGFEAKQAVSFGLDGVGHLLRPGRPERVLVQGWSGLDGPVKAKVRLRGAGGIKIEPASQTLDLPGKGSAEMPVTLTATESGVAPLKAECEVTAKGRTWRPKVGDLYLHFGRPGEVIGHVEKDHVILQSAALQVFVNRRGGWCSIGDKVHNLWQAAGVAPPQLGLPFAWDEFFENPCEARIERRGDRTTAVLTTPSVFHPGLWLERRITLSNLPVVEIVDSILNGSPSRFQGQLKRYASLRGNWVTVMTAQGLVRGLQGGAGRAASEHQLNKEQAGWPETWVAVEDDSGCAAGLLWEPAHRVHQTGGWNEVDHLLPPAEPGGSAAAAPFYLFLGDGDFLTVRRWWQNLCGPRLYREVARPDTRPALDFGLRPSPLVVHGRQSRARLVVNSVGKLEFTGRLRLRPPDGIGISPKRLEFKRVNEEHGVAKTAIVSRRASLPEGGYYVDCVTELDRALYRERSPVIVLGDPEAEVSVSRAGERDELYRIENGVLSLTVAPQFQGGAISLQRGGEEHLRSAYPKPRPLGWQNPWYGGIEPNLGAAGDDLAKEKFIPRTIRRRGSQGVIWQGVRVSCSPKLERARNEKLVLEYLLAPGSSTLAVVVRATRRTGTAGWIDAGFNLWPVVGGSHLDAVLSSAADARASRLRCEFGAWMRADRWAIAENPKAGEAVVLACHRPHANTESVVFGTDGYFFGARQRVNHEAWETRESVFFISFTEAARARDLAEALSGLKTLP